jgi:hypothetical protein
VVRKLLFFAAIAFFVLLIPLSEFSADVDHPPTPNNESGYVGSTTCARCHANTSSAFQQTWHPGILRPVNVSDILGDFSGQDPIRTFTRDDVTWVVGGQYKQRYLTEIDGTLYVLPAEWNLEMNAWVPYEVENWRSRPYNQYCAGCHTTGYDPITQTWVEPGVGCEACHGPGGDHVAAAGDRTKIVNPAELEFQDQTEVCAQCHSRGEDPTGEFPFPVGYRPGGPAKLLETFVLTTDPVDFWPDGTAKRHHMQYQDWRQGTHFESVGCIFCHTAHSVGETDHQTRMVGNDRCLVCHEGNADLGTHIPYMASSVDEAICTDCHMPKVSMLISSDFQIRSHTFKPPDPALSIAYGGQERMPNACNLCHTEESPEWAAAILGHETPPDNATRVPIPTQPTVPTKIPLPAITSGKDETPLTSQIELKNNNLLMWGAVLALLIALSGAVLAYRKVKLR